MADGGYKQRVRSHTSPPIIGPLSLSLHVRRSLTIEFDVGHNWLRSTSLHTQLGTQHLISCFSSLPIYRHPLLLFLSISHNLNGRLIPHYRRSAIVLPLLPRSHQTPNPDTSIRMGTQSGSRKGLKVLGCIGCIVRAIVMSILRSETGMGLRGLVLDRVGRGMLAQVAAMGDVEERSKY